jgi:hypothetical protein
MRSLDGEQMHDCRLLLLLTRSKRVIPHDNENVHALMTLQHLPIIATVKTHLFAGKQPRFEGQIRGSYEASKML